MKTPYIVIVLGLLVSGCQTLQFVSKEFNPTRGTIRYPVVQGREDLDRQWKIRDLGKFCKGEPIIKKEYERMTGEGSTTASDVLVQGISHTETNYKTFHYIDFECPEKIAKD